MLDRNLLFSGNNDLDLEGHVYTLVGLRTESMK